MIGGTGFIGRHVLARLVAMGHEVTVVHRGEHEPTLPPSVRHVHSELAVVPVVEFPRELTSAATDVVIHMVLVGERDAEAAVRSFSGVAARLIAVSSGDVYRAYGQLIGSEHDAGSDDDDTTLLSEAAPLRRVLYPYGREAIGPWGPLRDYEKILVERVVMSAPDLAGTVLRLPKLYGPGDRQHTLLPFVRRMLDHRPAILLGAAQARWRWTHGYVENVADAIAVATTDARAARRIYNVGERPTPTTEERVRMLGSVLGWRGDIVILSDDHLPRRLMAPYSYTPHLAFDTSRIRDELHWREPVTTDEGLRRTADWERTADPASAHLEYPAEDETLLRNRG
jgi:nucleoside-diphosphate-sugar epimerase